MEARAVGQPDVRAGATVIEASTRRGYKPLCELPNLIRAAQLDGRPLQAEAPVDPHLSAVDQHVADGLVIQQRGERADSDEVVGDAFDKMTEGRTAEHPGVRLGLDGRDHPRGRRRLAGLGTPAPDSAGQIGQGRGAHRAATPPRGSV